jgi:hypothetical protein
MDVDGLVIWPAHQIADIKKLADIDGFPVNRSKLKCRHSYQSVSS